MILLANWLVCETQHTCTRRLMTSRGKVSVDAQKPAAAPQVKLLTAVMWGVGVGALLPLLLLPAVPVLVVLLPVVLELLLMPMLAPAVLECLSHSSLNESYRAKLSARAGVTCG